MKCRNRSIISFAVSPALLQSADLQYCLLYETRQGRLAKDLLQIRQVSWRMILRAKRSCVSCKRSDTASIRALRG